MKKLPPAENAPKPEKVKDPRKTGILKTFLASLLMIALGVLMMLYPDFANPTVASVLGWSMVGVGALLVAVSLLNWNIMGIPELLIGLAMIAVGIFVIITPDFVADSFGRIIAVYVGFHGLLSLMDSGKLKKLDRNFMPHTVLGIVMIAVALVLVFVPVRIHWLIRVLGALVALNGLGNLVLRSKFYLSLPKLGAAKTDV